MKKHALAAAVALAATVSASAFANGPDPDRVWVKFKPGSAGQVENALRAANGRVHHRFDELDAIAVSVPAQALNGLRNNPNIEYIEPDAPRYPMAQITPYGVPRVQAPEAVAVGADGTGIKVCVIDSGIKANHEDFAGVSMTGSASSGQTWSSDSCGHGTHVAGTIAAANNNLGVIGVSPGKVSLHIVKVFDGASCAWSYSSSLVAAAQNCQSAGAKVINMSLGGSTSSTTERNAFANLYSAGILSIAAAGNDGNNRHSYPASYDSVMSVAATDSNNVVASFSQFTTQVEIAAPGVGVLSTYPSREGYVSAPVGTFMATAITGSPQLVRSAASVDGGLCTASSSAFLGKVVLCERGSISFSDKVLNAQNGGAVAVVIYNNVDGSFAGTLNGVATSVPSVAVSREDGLSLRGAVGQTTTVSAVVEADVNGYAYLDGTSMATPHVAGVAALVWSAKPTATNAQVRQALTSTAIDLGAAGRDNYYGHGLVQALAATEALLATGQPAAAPTGLAGSNGGVVKGKTQFNLSWSGGAASVDVFRGTTKIASAIANTGAYTDAVKTTGSGSFSYKVCNAGTSSCTATVSIAY
jgi:serine protease